MRLVPCVDRQKIILTYGDIQMSEIKSKLILDGNYEITADGKLFSIRSKKYLKPAKDKYGYLAFTVSINNARSTLKAHRLVAQAFIPNPLNKPTVNHRNGVRTDNRVENLEWATHKEQSNDPLTYPKLIKTCLSRDYKAMGEMINFNRKRTAVYKNGQFIGTFESLKAASEFTGDCYSKASEMANGKRKSRKGWVYKYEIR